MSPALVQSAVYSATPLVRKMSVKLFLNAHIRALNAISLICVASLVIGYIVVVTGTITKGYEIRNLETQLRELTIQNQQLELTARETQSLEHVAKSIKMLGFVKSEIPNYVDATVPVYAMAE